MDCLNVWFKPGGEPSLVTLLALEQVSVIIDLQRTKERKTVIERED